MNATFRPEEFGKPERSDGSVDEQEMDSPFKEYRTGAIVAGLFFVGFLGWAAMTPLDAGAMASGVVAVSGNRQAVQHRDGGIVTALNIVEGKLVQKGDVLLKISASELVATERGLTGEVLALLAQRERLIAEREHLAQVPEPVEFAALDAEDTVLAQAALRGQRQLFEARRNAIHTERAVLTQRMAQHSRQIGGIGHQLDSNHEQRRLIAEELEGLRSLAGRGFVSINRMRAMEREVAELKGDYGALQSDVARTHEAIGEARMQVVSLDRKMIEEVATQLREVQVHLDELQPRLVAARERLTQAVVRAPASGRIVGLSVFTVGGVVGAGATLMEIVPQNRALIVEAKALPTDADDLHPGMKTQVRFSGLQERNLPILEGRIAKVSADSFEDERTGHHFFKIEVAVPRSEIAKIRQIRGDSGIRAGLPAEIMVPLRPRTALGYMVEPLTQMLWRAGHEH